ncbi:TonB-dependent siderophore receptor [Salinicola peritrichatus]|uniref:TonB-dependent siderophore receptor n=1 Tax=Salinicola peritrichatus TaxID=1267424 RepID=UPI000DA1FF74|nr:TonB-dependent siderophore receptor [Salinicola peritrichatus]
MTSSFQRFRHWGWPVALGLSLTASGSGVWAQETSGDTALRTLTVKGNRLYEMLPSEVTGGYTVDAATVGTKTPASLRDIPQSISVVTRDAIEDQNFDTLDEMAKRTPGMRVLPNDSGRSSIYSRGYEYDEYNIDGLPAPMSSISGSVPNLAAFDRVEIMRGPSGLFNSTSEMGGIVNLVRKRPTETFQGHVTGRYGSWDKRYLESDLSGPITSDGRVRGRLVVADSDSNGFADHNENQHQTFYGAIDADLDDATTLSLAFLRQHRDLVPNNGLPTDANGNLLDFTRSTFVGADWNDFTMQSNDWFAELTHRFANGGYGRFAARYSDRNASYNYAFGGSALDAGSLSIAGNAADIDQQALSMDASYSQPFEAMGNVSEFVVGTDYKRFETDNASARANLGTTALADFNDIAYVDILDNYLNSDTRQTLEEYGLYGKVTFRPVQPFALIVGGRVSSYRVGLSDHLNSERYTRDDDGKFTGYAGAVFDLDSYHTLYASYSQVFKPQTEYNANGDLLKPREGEQYEVGIKGSYFGGDLNARISAFRLYDDNYAAAVANEDYSADIGKRRIQGAEFEVTGALTPQWDIIAGYTYLDTEVERGDLDSTFALMPHNTVNLWTQYAFAPGPLDGWHVGGGVTAMSNFHTLSNAPRINAPGYAIVDAMVGYDFSSHLSGQLNFNNIFDRDYYYRVGSVGTFNMYGAPSNVVASLRYDF